jgi:hypothetical protein
MPQSHQVTKSHKVLNICNIFFVNLFAFEPWWQKKLFVVDSIYIVMKQVPKDRDEFLRWIGACYPTFKKQIKHG